jgi:hypothetical protein
MIFIVKNNSILPLFKIVTALLLTLSITTNLVPLNAQTQHRTDHKLWLSTQYPKQGGSIRIKLLSNRSLKGAAIFFNKRKLPLFKTSPNKDTSWRGYLGISRYLNTGKHPITFRLYFSEGGYKDFHKTLYVEDGQFRKSIINLTPKKQKLAKRSTLGNESAQMAAEMTAYNPLPFFVSPFIRPARGRRSSPFGSYRNYLDNSTSSKHSGTDYANSTGSPIIAANTGKVVFSKTLKSHGNTIIINHGLGIYTLYNHLNSRAVTKGDWVKKGQFIGELGHTGISTGPHLHWGLSIFGTRVNPEEWLSNGFLYP